MSVDVSYYSFSPSRADEQWPHFIEDISVLRKKHATWNEHKKDSQEHRKKVDEIEARFKPLINQIYKKIFDHFSAKGYVIPWIEWNQSEGTNKHGNPITMTDEDKMEYLKVYGCVYPRGANLKDKNVSYLMLKTDAPELEEAYEKIMIERGEAIDKLSQSTTIAPMEDKSAALNKRQEKLDSETDLSYLKYENVFDNDRLIYDLKDLDIYYGSVTNEYFENPKVESIFLDVMAEVFKIKNDKGIPTRDEWIGFFQNIDNEVIQKASDLLMKALDWDKDEAEWAIKDYLQSVQPVAKDLKEASDSFFVRIYGGEVEVEPKNAESLLLERAKKHAIKYKGLLPPVL